MSEARSADARGSGPPVAAVDIGTNSVRVLIAEPDGAGGLRTHHRKLWLTRLGQGVDQTGRLADEAIARTADAVSLAARAWRARGVQTVRITATSAARDAANGDDLRRAIESASGVTPEVIAGDEEADLAFAGACLALPDSVPRPVVVLDIGGGSTELIIGDTRAERRVSQQLGSVRITERHLAVDAGGAPCAEQVARARAHARDALAAAAADIGITPPMQGTLIAVAGTATTVGAIALGLDGYDAAALHGLRLDLSAVAAIESRLLDRTAEQIAEDPAVEDGREDVIAGGAMILLEAMHAVGARSVRISTTDVLDGIALDLLRRR